MITSICNYKGGTGKTTTAVHIAAALNKRGKTILLDGDENQSAAAWNERGNLRFPVIRENELEAAGAYTHLVVDTAARPTADELETIVVASDILIIPSQPDALALDTLLKLTKALKKLNARNYKVLFTLVQPNSHHAEEAKQLLEQLEIPFFNTFITRRAVFTRAALHGTTVENLKQGGTEAWKEFTNLAKEILKYETTTKK
jgi:chromosome partitioning protein